MSMNSLMTINLAIHHNSKLKFIMKTLEQRFLGRLFYIGDHLLIFSSQLRGKMETPDQKWIQAGDHAYQTVFLGEKE